MYQSKYLKLCFTDVVCHVLGSAILLLLLGVIPAHAQKKKFREQTFSELLSIIENPFELLGKTDSAIVDAGRPARIIGGDIWTVEVIDTEDKNELKFSKSIVIGTGRAGILLLVSRHTGLVFYITFFPRREARIRGVDMIGFLRGKYKFDQKGMCFFKTGSNENIALDVMDGAINIMAFQDDKTAIMFSK